MKSHNRYLHDLEERLREIDFSSLELLHRLIIQRLENGGRVILMGNGGSAANSLHWATDLNLLCLKFYPTSKFYAYSLCENISTITAYSNDISYQEGFTQIAKKLVTKNDLAIGLSSSGKSENILRCFKYIRQAYPSTVLFSIVGYDGGVLKHISDHCIHVRINNTQIAEDMQMICLHTIYSSIQEIFLH